MTLSEIRLYPDQADTLAGAEMNEDAQTSSTFFCNLPDDIFVTISEFCNIETRCALTRTSRSQSKFIGRVKMTECADCFAMKSSEEESRQDCNLLFAIFIFDNILKLSASDLKLLSCKLRIQPVFN